MIAALLSTRRRAALVVLGVAVATIGGAWIFEAMGFAPCELCLKQRIPYYAGIPLAAFAAIALQRGGEGAARIALALLGLLFAAGTALALYHSGVELKLFPGPSECTGALSKAGSFDDFRSSLDKMKVVSCDRPALRIFALTLSNWNVLISAALAAIAFRAARGR
ncbi:MULTISPECIES: disulfide bond formation protein B [Methylosinus]|uniref:Disulfide bond formation protein B n=1 Tax=Methylosinus sporium TaxID=428 RepID=A0A2U1SSY3_METSR|nr:disulfide bond formation protein B [Methylosinus sporium]MBU3887716.1 disulfide bond formation protein B [Methylosinus sp. KRF6]PWB94715.1 disulfide bond formation protein B [Methylosinus sporium]TRL38343.1 disulfide bond formation protein B [Methylosinus sporium]